MKKLLLLPVLLLLTTLVALGLARPGAASADSAAGSSAGSARGARPVIVEVEGNKADGFTLHYADGTTLSPPTDSEAAAECSEYDTAPARLRCNVEVRTWYRDLGDLKRSLAYVRAHG